MSTTFTLLAEGRATETAATIDGGSIRIGADALARATGWELKPQGLCKDDRCVPVRDRGRLVGADGLDLRALADVLGCPLAVDVDERVACLGASSDERGARLASLEAPDFTLPDLNGKLHSLSDQRGKKVLLVAYASW
jgi:hypothetical protein